MLSEQRILDFHLRQTELNNEKQANFFNQYLESFHKFSLILIQLNLIYYL